LTCAQIIPTEAKRAATRDVIDRKLKATKQRGKTGTAAMEMRGNEMISIGENEIHLQSDPAQHAEMVAIHCAAAALDAPDLSEHPSISTLQPFDTSRSAIRFAGIGRIISAARQANLPPKYFALPTSGSKISRAANSSLQGL